MMGALTWLFQILLCFSQYQVAFSSLSLRPSFASSANNPLCRHDQRSALLQFKHMFTINSSASYYCDYIGIPSYPKTLSWDENAAHDCCEWDGVTCNGLTGHVIGLDLSCSQLYGTIQPNSSLFQLSHLQRLNLALNHFNFSRISYAFGSFASLTHLNLSRSAFSGSIPSELSLLSKLISLDLSSYRLKLEPLHFKILVRNLTQLQELVLNEVNISSSLPESLTNLSSLTALDLSWTKLLGNLPDSIFHLPNLQRLLLQNNEDLIVNLPKSTWGSGSSLKELDLSYTNLSGELPDSIGNLKSLKSLHLYETSLSGKLPNSIGNLKSLKSLDLHWTSLSRKLPNSIGFLKSLNYLNLALCKLRGSIPKSLGNLTQIRELDLSGNGFDGEVLSTLSNLKQLTLLGLSSINLEGRIPLFAEFTKLETLYLGDNNLIGGFPLWLANLKQLSLLYISYNQLTGPIPFNLSGFQNLRALYSSYNSFSGVIPPSLFTLPSLIDLDLSSNNLTGEIPEFQHHLPLRSISLSDNKLRGPIPQSISTLANLTWLSLASNDLSGVVDLHILKNVEYFDISNTNLSVVAGSNVNNTLPNLRGVYMSSCNIEVFPDFLRASENLEELDLSTNRIHGQILNWVAFIGKASLRYLNLSNNYLTHIKQFSWERLETLDLRSNLLQGPLLIPPPSIQYFLMSNNSLYGEIPSLLCNASFLQMLDLSHNKLSGEVPQCLGNSSSILMVLSLRSNGFKGTLPLTFEKPNQLRCLDLSENHFEGPLPRSLVNCRSLEVLNVGNNKFNDTFPNWLGTLSELQVLVVRSNRFHGPINTGMSEFSFPKLRIVDLSYNEFTGHLPMRYFENFRAMKNTTMPSKQYMSVGGSYYHDSLLVTIKGLEIELVRILTIFTTIDLSSNNFSGEIPNAVGKLNSLKVLNFSHNSLTGHIPESLGDLTSLESLDISSNHLTGRIPSQLTNLTFLEILNLSCNRLHGPIPNGRQFNTFENGSYAGNLGLCGFPLSKECGDNQTKVQPPVFQHEEDDSDLDGFTWKIVVIGYGCGMTMGLFLGSLMLLIGRPRFFVKLAERKLPKKVIRMRRTVADIVARKK
ncbi:receptor-like protein 53 [Rhododendron vialii]|uniref:receptor-like protein 53 n=1 Tax=Rhododendron vialii TaxID=182163 RepID=UPI00265EDFA8|nr:receptor-like protein 53 [Rhododendron vialii]XP_058182885.1 receptor-like protein 53 [Rhododendron vialii]XP_058182893.1 receptor-like protein 53 [Rhododendron vialii]